MLGVLVLLAIVASVIMVFTDSVPLLRIGVVAALWAAVVGAIAMTKFRKDSENDAARARDLKLVYELQLDREISARREYELVVETQVRQQVEERMRAESSEELDALRSEVVSLRASLEALFDGELPDERPAVRAESHRLQELGGPGERVAEQAADLPELDDVVAVAPETAAAGSFEPDYEAYREAAQNLPGVGDGADGAADVDGHGVEGTDADGIDADGIDADEVDTDAVVVEGPEVVGSGVDQVGAEDAVPADDAVLIEDDEPSEAAGVADGTEVDEPERTGAPATRGAETAGGEDDGEQDASEHAARPGGNTVAELLERMAESGTLPENIGRRRRRARD